MALMTTDRIIKDYYEEIKDKYPNIDYDKFEKICKSIFYFIRTEMAAEDMPIIKIDGFGRFVVTLFRMRGIVIKANRQFEKGLVHPERHAEKDAIYKKIIKKLELDAKTTFEVATTEQTPT